ncbi:hypothetical protein MuYL_1214 [Mucilaginibacter xinganensis]|uniref:Uncharacterized protein n=1 Tax=Mucilaginibacter xinganensis TaxID=1234841 RepID=A0A223NTV9_9SPHI|nr:hypothetical protein MuYL_1214 [Mucilaginibacter xinganensis]
MFNRFLITALIAFTPFLLSAQTIKPGPENVWVFSVLMLL